MKLQIEIDDEVFATVSVALLMEKSHVEERIRVCRKANFSAFVADWQIRLQKINDAIDQIQFSKKSAPQKTSCAN
jgi:hypothetical protein